MPEVWTPAPQPARYRPQPPMAYQPLAPLVPWMIGAAFAYFMLTVVNNVLGYTNTGAVLVLSLVAFPLTIGALVILLLWSHRAAVNTDAFGAKGRTLGSAWAIVGWIIPIANWVLPYLAFRDIWKASDPDLPPDAWDAAPIPGWFHLWWLTWVAAAVLAHGVAIVQAVRNVGDAIERDVPPANPFTQPTYAPDLLPYIAAFLGLYTIAFILFVRLVRELDKRQQAKAERIAVAPSPTTPPPTWNP